MPESRDPLDRTFIGKDSAVTSDLYKFESAIGTLVTYNFGDYSSTANTAISRNLDLGAGTSDATKVVLRPKTNHATITKINGIEQPSPIVVFVGTTYQINYGKFVTSMEVYFDVDNTIMEVQAYR